MIDSTISKTRIYIVTIRDERRLVRAVSQAAALGHVVRDIATVRVASQDDLERAFSAGLKVTSAARANMDTPPSA